MYHYLPLTLVYRDQAPYPSSPRLPFLGCMPGSVETVARTDYGCHEPSTNISQWRNILMAATNANYSIVGPFSRQDFSITSIVVRSAVAFLFYDIQQPSSLVGMVFLDGTFSQQFFFSQVCQQGVPGEKFVKIKSVVFWSRLDTDNIHEIIFDPTSERLWGFSGSFSWYIFN